jgi:hypothetical protein
MSRNGLVSPLARLLSLVFLGLMVFANFDSYVDWCLMTFLTSPVSLSLLPERSQLSSCKFALDCPAAPGHYKA